MPMELEEGALYAALNVPVTNLTTTPNCDLSAQPP
jgi:hypothetical protein